LNSDISEPNKKNEFLNWQSRCKKCNN